MLNKLTAVVIFMLALFTFELEAANYTLSVGRFSDITEAEDLIKYLKSIKRKHSKR